MKTGKLTKLIFAATGMLVLIFDGQTAADGIRYGIDICLHTLIPSLFPFFVLSGLVTSALIGQSVPFLNRITRLIRIPVGSESLLAVGILGGYPVGAKVIRDAYGCRILSKEEAQRTAVLCNNPGPSFLFGILGPIFPKISWVWLLWFGQICSAIVTGILLPGGSNRSVLTQPSRKISISESLNQSIKSMSSVCGWVVLFRMILEFLDKWCLWLFPTPVKVLVSGVLELANGCMELSSVGDPAFVFLLAAPMLAFGGLCVLMQTKSVFPELDLRQYVYGKALQTAVLFLLTVSVTPLLTKGSHMIPIVSSIFAFLVLIFLMIQRRNRKKRGSNSILIDV